MKDKKQYIIQCTHELFKEKGYLETSIQDILVASDVAKGTFYKYFNSKSSLTLELLKALDEKLNSEISAMFFADGSKSDIENVRTIICYIKQFERDHAMRRIMAESVVDRDTELMEFLHRRRQKSLIWLYQCIETAFGTQYPHALTDATLFLHALISNLTKYSFSGEEKLSIETVVNNCFDKLLLCLDDMNKRPIFHSDIISKSNMITNNEQFIGATLHLKKWLKTNFSNQPKYELFINYTDFIILNFEHLDRLSAMKSQIIQELEQELIEFYPNILEYTQYLQLQ